MKQDCSYQGEALNVPTSFNVYGAVITIKKLNETRLFVSGRSPECSDRILMFMEQ